MTRHEEEVATLREEIATYRDALVMAEEREREMVTARAIQAAEIERLREIERCADALVDDPGSLAKQDNLRAALGAK